MNKPNRRKSLATQLTWVSILMVTLALLAMGAGLILIADRAQQNSSSQLQKQSAEQVSQLISNYINHAAERLVFFLENEPLSMQAPEQRKTSLENLLIASLPLYSMVSLLDRDGWERDKVSRFHTFLPKELKNQADNPAFISVLEGKPYIGNIEFLGNTGLLSLTIALPIRSPAADIVGALIAEVNISHLWQDVARIKIGQSGYAYLVDNQGRFVAYQKPTEVLQRYGENVSGLPPVNEFVNNGREETGEVRKYDGLFGQEVIGVYAPIKGTNWAVIVEQPISEAYASISKMKKYLLYLLFFSIIIAGGLGWYVSRRMIGPIRTLTDAAQRLGDGELETRFLNVQRQDEVGVLSNAFIKMQKDLQVLYTGLKQKVDELEATQEALKKSEEQYRLLIENQLDFIVKMDLDGRFLFVSPSYCKLFGETEQELLGREFIGRIHEDDWNSILEETERLLQAPHKAYLEHRTLTADGWMWIGWQFTAVRDEKGEVVSIIGVGRDINDRMIAEAALKESEEKFRTLVEESPLGVSIIKKNGSYHYINPQFINIFGYTLEDIPTGRDWFRKAFPDETYRHTVVANWKKDHAQAGVGESRPLNLTVTCKDGSTKEISFRTVTMENLDQFVIYEDITEKVKIEQQLQQTRKFEAIGTLAGGIAHDFNNLLMGLQGRASLMAVDMEASHPHMEHINAIEEYIHSATDLTKQLLGFARGGKYEVKPININELVTASSSMFGRTRKEIRIHTKLHEPPPVAEVDRNQIEQVLLNIYINAWQSMPEGGMLFIETKVVDFDELSPRYHQLAPGSYVKVSITDSGTGMDEVTRQKIFDPFFTTKEKGRGTGLGLASAYGIVSNHGGLITVYSEVGHGATFNIYLPASEKEAHREVPLEEGLFKGTGRILLVDDEEMIIDVAQSMLETLGYQVVACRSGREALDKVYELGDEIDLVIVDMIMPGMDGGETFDHIRELYPEMPVILSSGYTINGQANEIMQRGCNGFIQKPFNLRELSKKVRSTLEAVNS